jgi:hypothetical protein
MRRLKTICVTGLLFALGLAEASAASSAAPKTTVIAAAADNTSDHAVWDLGLLPAPASSDNLTPGSASASTESSAEPIPELPTWTMMLVFFTGLGLAGLKKGRKNRLSSGIE